MRPSSLAAGFTAFFIGMVLLKDGTLPRLFGDFARGASDFATGIRPITRVG